VQGAVGLLLMLRPQDGGYGSASCGPSVSIRSNPAMAAFATFWAALPPCLRFRSDKRRSLHIQSDDFLLIAAQGPAVLWNSKIRGSWHHSSDPKQRSDPWMAEVEKRRFIWPIG